jgi:ABC-type Mn2+/Zn2+ transport system permease subunit
MDYSWVIAALALPIGLLIGRWWALVAGPILAALLAAAGVGEGSSLGRVDVAVLVGLLLTVGIAIGIAIRKLASRP